MTDTRTRTIIKAMTWQLWGLATMSLLAWFQTGSLSGAFGFALSAAATGFVCYFVHERLWSRVRWGRVRGGA